MILDNDEQHRPLVDQRVSIDILRDDEEQAFSYNTFGAGASLKKDNGATAEVQEIQREDHDPEYTWTAIFMVMSSWIGVFLASVDNSVMATLTGPISESFSSFDLLTWFINSYTISSALIQPLSGKLSDLYGRRNCLLWANVLFMVGNAICGLATDPWHFILGRVIAGLGGGCLNSVATFLAGDVIPLRQRGFWQGVSNIAFGAGFALGGTFGGLINDTLGWRWAFLAQPAPILVSILLVFWIIPKSTNARQPAVPSIRRIDFLGSSALTLAILALMFGAVSGGNILPWSSPFVYVPLALFPFLLSLFCYVELNLVREPMIPIRSLANRTVLGACFTNMLSCAANASIVYYVPMNLQTQGVSATMAGLHMIPNAMGIFIGSLGSGGIMNVTGKYRSLLLSCQFLSMAAALALLFTAEQSSTGWIIYVTLFMNGSGIGGMLVTTLLALISAADHTEHATLTSASYAFRSTGNTLGVTIAGTIFQNVFGQQLWNRLGSEDDAKLLIPAIRRRDVEIDNLPWNWRQGVLDSYCISFKAVFAFIFAAYIAATITACVIREHRLDKTLEKKPEVTEA